MDTTITFTPSELVAFIGTIAGVCRYCHDYRLYRGTWLSGGKQ